LLTMLLQRLVMRLMMIGVMLLQVRRMMFRLFAHFRFLADHHFDGCKRKTI
jgi:hypothetical protein